MGTYTHKNSTVNAYRLIEIRCTTLLFLLCPKVKHLCFENAAHALYVYIVHKCLGIEVERYRDSGQSQRCACLF